MARGAKWFSYKRIAIAVCCVNLVAAVVLLRAIFTSSSLSSNGNPFSDVEYTDEQLKKVEESNRVRRELEPVELIKLAKKLNKELRRDEKEWKLSPPMKQKLANEILLRLKGLSPDANSTEQREAVELWRAEKQEEIKMMMLANSTSKSSIPDREAKLLKKALELYWVALLEDIGFWMPADVVNSEIDDKPENAQELEEEIIPGPPLPPECHAELHADYDGAAVRWGLTHHKESAAECCQACLDQAKNARVGQKKCNIWVYCPSESGCHSPDIYEHKHQECWLKQAEKPGLNFKDKYSEQYRNSHPTAPVVVPWMSGVVSASLT